MNNFVPLRVVSCYSFLQSGLTIERIATGVTKNAYFGVGLCDKGVMYGVPSFIKAMEGLEKLTIIGLEIKLDDDTLGVYAINEEGYRNLLKISTAIQKKEFDRKFLEEHTKGLLAIIETSNGKFKELFVENSDGFNRYLLNWNNLFKSGFYLGVEVTKKEDVKYANSIRKFASEHSYETVAFPQIRYLKKDDAIVLRIAEAIANEEQIKEKKAIGQEYFMSITDYQKIYTPKEILNTQKILEKSKFDFHQKRGELFHYPVEDSPKALKDNCYEALSKLGLEKDEEYTKRLDYELETINSLGYADYFLIVQDYVSYAKNHDIIVGPGRGSAAGSLVSYLLNITEIDPLKNGLQFERFLNPYRKTMPDIDVDFMDIKRDLVVDYMREKYGNEHVANIVTFQTIQAKQSLRDIGRVYGYSNNDIDLLSKRITNPKYSLREAYKKLPEFKKLIDSDNYYLEIVSLASKIEGLIRQSGLHAAGIILNNDSLEEALPILTDFNNHYISQYEMGYLEEQGFLKMDFLGLRNLTTIDYCVSLIKKNNPNADIDVKHIPYDDPNVYKLIASLQTMGVFQLESSGMKRAISILKPSCFNDIVALLALFRPGPMDSINTYAKRKEGKEKIIYDDSCLEPILKETYGIIVYQEQVNMIATTMAGFSMGEADMFRRAISKKDIDKLLESEKAFIEGSIKKGHNEKTAKKVFDFIKKFANYGFNKSHSVAYSVIACQMAYLKYYYPLEFYAAILETSSSTSDTKFNEYVSEMKQRNIAIISPNINKSAKDFVVQKEGLLFPLSAIKGINELFVNAILEERNTNGEYKDFFDFVGRMYRYKINEAQINKLIDAGCFDTFNPSRASFRASIRSALQYSELVFKENDQLNIGFSDLISPYLIEDHDDPLENLDKEYEVLGIMLSNNPLHYKTDILRAKKVTPIIEAKNEFNAVIAGMIRSVKTITTKKGATMAFIKIMDETDEIELTLFPEAYQEGISLLEKNSLIIATIKREKRDDNYDFICNKVEPLEE